MITIPLYNQTGNRVGEIELSQTLFGVKPNPSLVHQVVVGLQANAREVIAHTKTRGEVRGGGKKPWKQKHTGRARAGSTRSPIWIGGGVTFGPRNDRSYAKKIPKAMKRAAFAAVLSDKVQDGALVAVDALTLAEPKTKLMAATMKTFAKNVALKGKKQLLIVEHENRLFRATRNIPSLTASAPEHVSILDIVGNPTVIATQGALRALEKKFAR